MTLAARRAVVLSAGKGSRLLPLTEDRPKCLIEFAGRTLLEWQLDSLEAAGIDDIVVVTGFRDAMVDAVVAARTGSASVRTFFNPFYHVADNLGSIWLARAAFDTDLLILNGDTLVPPELIATLLRDATADVTVTVDRKPAYDADDMKVLEANGRLLRIGKSLAPGAYNAESIGLLGMTAAGARTFIDLVDRIMHTPEGTANWYLRAIDRLADHHPVGIVSIEGMAWQEVDYPADVEAAEILTKSWRTTARSA